MGLGWRSPCHRQPRERPRVPPCPALRTLPVLRRGCKPSFSWRIGAPDLDRVRKDAPAASHRRLAEKETGERSSVEKATRRGNYESGSDYVLEYGELRFSFNEEDFAQRVEQAAVKLDFVDHGLASEELHDLLELAVNGEIADPLLDARRAHQRELDRARRPVEQKPRPLASPPRLPRRLARPARQGRRAGRRLRRRHPHLRLRPARARRRADRAFTRALMGSSRLQALSQALQDVRVRARRFELLADEPRRFRRDELGEARAQMAKALHLLLGEDLVVADRPALAEDQAGEMPSAASVGSSEISDVSVVVTASNASPSSPSVVATTVRVPASSSASARPEPKRRFTSSTPLPATASLDSESHSSTASAPSEACLRAARPPSGPPSPARRARDRPARAQDRPTGPPRSTRAAPPAARR